MRTKTTSWPRVLPNDNGIRPAGKPNECLYCHSKVGQLHGQKCGCVEKLVRYDVLSDGVEVGTFERYDPHDWDKHNCEFHKNESSWCANNAKDEIKWLDTPFAQKVKQYACSLPEDKCCCGTLEFRFSAVVDGGPFVELREACESEAN